MSRKLSLCDIDRFLADRTVQNAIDASRQSRPLEICYPTELPLTRFLAWLFDPTQGHCLNDAVLRALLTACWENGASPALSTALRQRIAPTALAQLTLADVIIGREVNLTEDAGRLDVLILLPGQKLLIAIENKAGARQAHDQLRRYRTGLKARYKGWEHLLVFLDIHGAEPNDDRWIPLQYDWLIDELSVAEQALWLGEEPRRAIADFRRSLERFDDQAIAAGVEENRLLAMVRDHEAVFRQMGHWMRERQTISSLAGQVYRTNGTTDTALQALFPIYARRTDLWRTCIPMVDYAELRVSAQEQFEDLLVDSKSTGSVYFSLERWNKLARPEFRYWPFNVCVWERFDVPESARFAIESNIVANQLAEDQKERLRAITKAIRSRHQSGGAEAARNKRALRMSFCATREAAAAALCEHLDELASSIGT